MNLSKSGSLTFLKQTKRGSPIQPILRNCSGMWFAHQSRQVLPVKLPLNLLLPKICNLRALWIALRMRWLLNQCLVSWKPHLHTYYYEFKESMAESLRRGVGRATPAWCWLRPWERWRVSFVVSQLHGYLHNRRLHCSLLETQWSSPRRRLKQRKKSSMNMHCTFIGRTRGVYSISDCQRKLF